MADPNNILNQNLTLGGDLVVLGNTALDGNVVITGNENITGDMVAAGRVVSGSAFGLITPTLGRLALDYTEVLVTLDTTSATTTFSFGASGLPVEALVIAMSIRVVTTITGATSTTGTLNVNPVGPGSPVGSISTFTAGAVASGLGTSGTVITQADAGSFVLSGGGDNTPSGGSIRVTVYFGRATAPTS